MVQHSIPSSLEINAWTGKESPKSGIAATWQKWASRSEQFEAREFLPALPPVDLRRWQDPAVGWGLILPENDRVSARDKALGLDAPEPFQRLLESRRGAPILRYFNDGRGVALRRYYQDGSSPALQITLANRGSGKNQIPWYLLIGASPKEIPWSFQYQLNSNAFTGRLDLEGKALEDYIDALIAGWPESPCTIEQPLVWMTDYGQEDITWLMRQVIGEPVSQKLKGDTAIQDKLCRLSEADATWDKLIEKLTDRKPAFILTTSHGMTGPLDEPEVMARNLGLPVDALKQIYSPEQLLSKWEPDGAIWYAHACCSAGCDCRTSYKGFVPEGSMVEQVLSGVAKLGARTAPLPKALLGAKKPLRAFIGHVEPAFDWTLRDPENRQVFTTSLRQALYEHMHQQPPEPVGLAFRQFFHEVAALYQGWDAVNTAIAEEVNPEKREQSEKLAARLKLNALDRQSFVILGDPTVALPEFHT